MTATDHESVKSDLHRAALDYAAKGWPVFPIQPGTKVPATEHGFHDATVDPAQIDAWWSAMPDANIAFSPHQVGLSIVDLDGPDAETNWAFLQDINGHVETYEVETPRGRHLYFLGELPPTQSKLANHVDTRGRGSYALLPPSNVGGRSYSVRNPRPAVAVPAWVSEAASRKREVARAAHEGLDLPGNVARAREYLTRAAPAIEGQMGDKQTFVVACDVLNLGISQDKTFELMLDIYNPRCEPEWDPEELETKIANAAAYAQNEAGSWATGSAADVFDSEVLGRLIAESASSAPAPEQSRFRRWKPEEIAAEPKPEWLIPEMLPGRKLVMLYAPPDSYKSVITATLALDVAQTKDVLVMAGEDAEGFTEFVMAGRVLRGTPDRLEIVRASPFADDDDSLREFAEMATAGGFRPKLVVIDTASKMFGDLEENSSKDMNKFVHKLEQLARHLDATILVIHHTGKDPGRGARGSNALLGGFYGMLEVQARGETVAVWVRKMKGVKRRKAPFAFEIKPVAGSVVAQPVDPSAFREREQADDLIGPKRVAQFLRDLKAIGHAGAVTTHVLAVHAIQHSTDAPDDPEALEDAAKALASILRKRAKGNLSSVTYGEGEALRWAIPVDNPDTIPT